MKIIILILCFISAINSGCSDITMDLFTTPTPHADESKKPDATATVDNNEITPPPQPKISSDFENAPTAEEISNQTGKKVENVLLQDTLTYNLKFNDYFAVCLQEDAEQGYRWLWVNEGEDIEYIEETHINGYRVFIFKPVNSGETSILFELSQDISVIETLSYQLIFS